MQTIIYILPELFLAISILSSLMIGVFIKKSFKLVYLFTILSLIFTIALVLNQPDEIVKIFNNSYIIDKFSIFMKVLTLLFCIFVLFCGLCDVFLGFVALLCVLQFFSCRKISTFWWFLFGVRGGPPDIRQAGRWGGRWVKGH